jgi:mannose-1-phosphate guanylyltransferase
MLQNTILRINNTTNNITNNITNNTTNEITNKIQIICNVDHYFIIEKQLEELFSLNSFSFSFSKKNVTIVTEPKGRDSAPAICIASLLNEPDDYTFILPSDHILEDAEFLRCYESSFEFLNDSIVTFGIKPTRIETGYGYIQIGENNRTKQFVEKPKYEVAKTYIENGMYYWNAGIFCFQNKKEEN